MLNEEKRRERSMTMRALEQALATIKKGNTPTHDSVEKIEKAIKYLKDNPRVAYLSLSWLVSAGDIRPLVDKKIFTVSGLIQTNPREVKEILGGDRLSMPYIILCLHPEE